MTVMPAGYKAAQMKAEQPSTTYAMFKAELINEMARCLNMPYNVAACNSSSYNFASGRLDHLVYCKSVAIEQANIEAELLERLLSAWLAEALRAYSLERPDVAILSPSQVTATWVWDGYGSVNPVDESNARETDLNCNMVSYPTAYARAGMDWETEWRSDAKALNISFEEYQRRMAEKRFAVKGAATRPASDGAAQDQANQANDAQRRAERNARKLVRKAMTGREKVVFTMINVTGAGSSFFTTGHKNYISGATTVMGLDGLDAAVALFEAQTDAAGDPILITPSILLVPPGATKQTALQLVAAQSNLIVTGAVQHVGRRYNPAA